MDAKTIIEQDAERFMNISSFQNPQDFKNKLESQVYECNDSTDKLFFLYKVLSEVDTELKDHIAKCPTKGNCYTVFNRLI